MINFLPQRSQRSQSPFCRSGILGSARVSRAGDGVLAIANFSSTKGEGGPRYPNALALTYATLPPIYLRLRRFRKPSSSEKPIHQWHRDQRSWSSFCCSVRCSPAEIPGSTRRWRVGFGGSPKRTSLCICNPVELRCAARSPHTVDRAIHGRRGDLAMASSPSARLDITRRVERQRNA